MRHPPKLLRATLTASLVLVATAGAGVAGPLEDGDAAFRKRDYATALQLLRPLAEQGFAKAQYDLGAMYSSGLGVARDYAEAVKWYRLAAAVGFAKAQYGLGTMYARGEGVPQDYAEALTWYRLSADQGFVGAQYTLGELYAKGEGVPRDYVVAHMWYSLAAAQAEGGGGDLSKSAAAARDKVASKMTPAQIAEAQKLAREWKPKPER